MRGIPPIVWFIIGGLLILGGGAVVYSKIRGIRNNNPGNIKHSKDVWKGELPKAQQTDPVFVQFSRPEWGIRAMARDLLGDFREGKNTIRALINEWAPPVENDTSSYVTAVAKALRIGADERFSIETKLPDLIAAIIKHENGVQPYGREVILEGIRLEKAA